MYSRIVLTDARARAKPCLRCGYSLRKIDSLHCPECGLSVWLSLNDNDSLEASNPIWLKRLSLATAIMAWACGVWMAVPLVLLIGLSLQGFSNGKTVIWAVAEYGSLLIGAAGVLYCGGMLLLCLHENRYPDRVKIRRWTTRVAAAIAALASVLSVAAQLMPPGQREPFDQFLLAASQPVEWVVSLVCLWCTWWYLWTIARRGAHPLLTRFCGIMMVPPIVCAVACFWGGLLWIVLMILPWVYILASIALLICFSVVFRRTAKIAAATWAKETAGPEAKTPAPTN